MAEPICRFVFKTPFHGAQTTLYCTLEDSIEKDSGKYYKDCHEAPTLTHYAEDMDAASKARGSCPSDCKQTADIFKNVNNCHFKNVNKQQSLF